MKLDTSDEYLTRIARKSLDPCERIDRWRIAYV